MDGDDWYIKALDEKGDHKKAQALRDKAATENCPLLHNPHWDGYCDWCGHKLPKGRRRWCEEHQFEWVENHDWSFARHAAIRRDGCCVRCGSRSMLEVNHKNPRNGAGYHYGCHNHLALLEVLCHRCHVEETNRQAALRRAGLPFVPWSGGRAEQGTL